MNPIDRIEAEQLRKDVPPFKPGRHRARPRPGRRGRQGAHPGLRGHGPRPAAAAPTARRSRCERRPTASASSAPSRCTRPASIASRSPARAPSVAPSSTTCASAPVGARVSPEDSARRAAAPRRIALQRAPERAGPAAARRAAARCGPGLHRRRPTAHPRTRSLERRPLLHHEGLRLDSRRAVRLGTPRPARRPAPGRDLAQHHELIGVHRGVHLGLRSRSPAGPRRRTSPLSFPSTRVGSTNDKRPVISASGPSQTRTSSHTV